MTHSSTHQSGEGLRPGHAGLTEFVLPLVSVLIVNYNYGRFLSDAVSSVFAQNYKNIECFVIDNCSTDESPAVIEELAAAYPELKIVYRASNDGQCVASAEVFPETKGQYIVFLDADDVLLPDFIGTHIFVALSLYTHVGFTCSDIVQVVENEIVLSTSHTTKQLILERKDSTEKLLRPLAPSIWSSKGLSPVVDSELLFVGRDQRDWRWTATSAFMFRRDAIAILINNPRLKNLQCALDVYFARGINVITGSVVIDRPLCIYRMHGSNIFSRHAHLDRCLNFEPGGKFDQNEMARRELIDFWFAQAPFLIKKFTIREDFIDGLRTLNDSHPRLTDGPTCKRSYAAAQLLRHFAMLRDIVGLPTLLSWCIRLRISPFSVWPRTVGKAPKDGTSEDMVTRALGTAADRFAKRIQEYHRRRT